MSTSLRKGSNSDALVKSVKNRLGIHTLALLLAVRCQDKLDKVIEQLTLARKKQVRQSVIIDSGSN